MHIQVKHGIHGEFLLGHDLHIHLDWHSSGWHICVRRHLHKARPRRSQPRSFTMMTKLMLLHPLIPLLIHNFPWEWYSVCKQVLRVTKWEAIPVVTITQIQLSHGTQWEVAPSRPWLACPLAVAQLRHTCASHYLHKVKTHRILSRSPTLTQLMLLHPLFPLLIDNYPWEWFSVHKQVL